MQYLQSKIKRIKKSAIKWGMSVYKYIQRVLQREREKKTIAPTDQK